jgi:thiamine pyrophosphate-dependent acetolactate synthase large subunit-like protein
VSPPSESFERAARLLAQAKRPAVLLGPEGAAAVDIALALAERLGAAVLTTPDAKSLVAPQRSCGTFSFGSSALARAVMADADLVLALSSLGEFSCRMGESLRGRTLIQLSERVSEVGRNADPSVSLCGAKMRDLATRLEQALKPQRGPARAPWFCHHLVDASSNAAAESAIATRSGVIHPLHAMRAVARALPEAARVCLDVTSGALHAYEHLQLTPRQRTFSSIERSGCMGEALLASLGIRLASNLPTLALVGDWGFCMTPPELHTAVEMGLDRYVVLVWANGGGAFIAAGVQQQGIAVPPETWHWQTPPDLGSVARAYGARGVTVTSALALEDALRQALRGERPHVIEARIDPSVPVPAGDRFLTLGLSKTGAHDAK